MLNEQKCSLHLIEENWKESKCPTRDSSVWNINTMECRAATRNANYENYVEIGNNVDYRL